MSVRSSLAVLLVLVTAGPAATQPSGADVAVDAEIVLAVDASRSVDLAELAVQREGYLRALRHPDLIRAVTGGPLGRVAIAYFEWSAQAQDGSLVPWRIIDGPEAAREMAGEIAALPVHQKRGTSISRAIGFATALIDDGSVAGMRRVIDVSGDGGNNIGPAVTGARDAAVARGITINGLPVMTDPAWGFPELDRYYEDCVIGGEGAFMLVARNADELAGTIHRKLVLEISGLTPAPRLTPADFPAPIDCLMGERLRRERDSY